MPENLRRRWAWVTRDEDGDVVAVWTSSSEPRLSQSDGEWNMRFGKVLFLDANMAMTLFGLWIAPGTCQRVQFSATMLKGTK